jgi:hypothetical protein
MFRFAQHDKGEHIAATTMTSWPCFNRRFNDPLVFRALFWAFIVTATLFSVLPFLRYLRGHTLFDYELWYATGRHVLRGDEIYFLRAGKYDFMYPPPCALFLAVASLFGQGGLILLLVTINCVAWFYSAKLSAHLAGGDQATTLWLYLIPSLTVIVYVWSSYHLGQSNLVLLALMLGALIALRGKRELLAGALIAVAAAVKAFPVLALIYLIYRRYWRASVSLVGALAFLLLVLPAPFRGVEGAWRDLGKWSAGMLKYSEASVGQRPMRSYTWKNQSLVGVTNRLLRHVDADAASAPHEPVYVNFADLGFPVVNAIIIGIALTLGVVFIAVLPRREMRTAQSDAIEFALLLLLILMITPLSFGYFYCWLMLPFAVVIQRVGIENGSSILWWSLSSLALLALGIPFPRGAQLYGNTFFATLLLFIGLAIQLLCLRQQAARTRPATNGRT